MYRQSACLLVSSKLFDMLLVLGQLSCVYARFVVFLFLQPLHLPCPLDASVRLVRVDLVQVMAIYCIIVLSLL